MGFIPPTPPRPYLLREDHPNTPENRRDLDDFPQFDDGPPLAPLFGIAGLFVLIIVGIAVAIPEIIRVWPK